MKKVQPTLFQSWGTSVTNQASNSKSSNDDFANEDDCDLDDETLLAACEEWDSSDNPKHLHGCDSNNTPKHPNGSPLEDLPGFDVSAGHIWIYPTNMPVRDYQLNIVEKSLLKNTLVTLPTGLGKTFIAAVVMYNFYRWYPSGKIVFMAPTKPLVAQQIEACYNIMGIPQSHTAEMTGSMNPPERKKVWQSRRVFFLTPQVLMNDLSRKACPANDIKCLVFDEAHKALGNHSYCQVVRELSKYTVNFRVLALSATPGTDLKAVQQVLSNLMIAHIEIRSEDAIDIQKYVHNRTIDKYVVPLGKELQSIQEKYLQIVSSYVNKLYNAKCLYIKNPKSLTKYQVLMCRDAFRQDPPQNMQRAQQGVAEGQFAILISLYHGYELLMQHGMHSLQCFLTTMVDGTKGISRAKTELMHNHTFCSLMDELNVRFNVENDEINRTFSSSSIPHKPFVYSHPKLKKLEEIVLQHFDKFKFEASCSSDVKTSTRVMIFTQYRDSVHEITKMLNQHNPMVKCMSFVGQSSAGKSTKGFTQKEQLRVVKEFRSGGYNTIVSTCVGEEGLDIGDVDLIICYDAHKSPIRLVQRMGRTGRKRDGRIVILVTEGKEEQAYNQSLSNKRGIHKALHNSSRKLELYHNNHRMVPKGLNPVVHKMHLTVATAYKSKVDRNKVKSSSNQPKINNFKGQKVKDDSCLNEEELRFWNLHYKLDDHQKELVKTIPAGGRFLTIGNNKISEKIRKSSEFSLSEWSIWQTKKQPFKFVDHSKRCTNFVEIEEFLEVQSFADEEDVYGMEMATFLNKDDIIMQNSGKGIKRFCVSRKCEDKDVKCAMKKHEKTDSEVSTTSLSNDLIGQQHQNANKQNSGGKRKTKTKNLTSLQYSDDDDFKGNDLLPKHPKPGFVKAMSFNNHEKSNDSNGSMMSDKATNSSVQEFSPHVFLKSFKSNEHKDVNEDLPINDIVHNKSLDTDQIDEDQYSDLSIIFPSTQPINKCLSFDSTDKIFPKKFLPPEAPNVNSLDFLDDIDDLEQSFQISLNTINGHLQYLDKPKGKLNPNDNEIEKKIISGKPKVSEGIQIVKISHENSKVKDKYKVVGKEINNSAMDLDWNFDLSDGINKNIEVTEESTVKNKKSDVLLEREGLCVDMSSDIKCGKELTQKNNENEHSMKQVITLTHSQNVNICLTNECLVSDKDFQQITEIERAKEIGNRKAEKEELHKDSTDQKFDLQFDLNDFLNDDSDYELIPPTPAKYSTHYDRSKITQMSRQKFSRKSDNDKSQNNKLILSHIFHPSNSSTPEQSIHSHSKVSKSRIFTSLHNNLQSATNLSQKNTQFQPEASRKIESTQKIPDNETNRICGANHADIQTKGVKRKSDPLPAVVNDRQKKVKLTEEMQLMTDAATDCFIMDDKFDSIVHESKSKCTNKLEEGVADDSEDEIQPKIRKKMNVLSSPVTPVKPAKKSKYIVVSDDSEEEISSDELATPLKQRIFKKPSGIKNAVFNYVAYDQDDFQEITGIHENFTIKEKNTTEGITKRKNKHRQNMDNPVHDLLDLEAEVESDAGCSSDEDDMSQVDHSIIDFINDNTLCSQGADLQAIYLQSVKDNDNYTVKNRYRLAPQTEYDDQIFSQVPQQDDDYGDNSFVVYEEDNTKDDTNVNEITINPENIIHAKTRRGKQQQNFPIATTSIEKSKKNKKLTRRRVIIHDSSSEEENVMNHFQVGKTNRESKGSTPATSGTYKDRLFKSFVTLNTLKRNCDKTQEEIAREERLKRQKEKQLEFRKKMIENRKYESTKASGQNANLTNVLKPTDGQTSNKVDIDLFIKNDSNLTDKNLVEIIDKQCAVRGTVNEKIGSKSSTNNHLNKTSSNLKDEYGVSQKSQRCGGAPVVMVNPGVLSSCPHIASTLELQHNLNSIVHQLNGCDFMVSNRMGIIRKSFSDFANGANRNKLIDQIRYVCQLFDRPCLIVETDKVKKPEDKRIINHTKYLDKTIAQLIRTHVKLLFTNSVDETASILADLAHMESRKGFSIQLTENATQRQEQILKVCLSVPCLNFAGALCLSRNCSTFGDLISCSSSQLEVKARISSIRAQDLHQFFKHKFTSEMVINPC